MPRPRDPMPPTPAPPDPWAARVYAQAVQAAGPAAEVPEYGSAAFDALPETSPLRVASAVRAAEAWRTYWSPEEQTARLAVELSASRAAAEAEQLALVRQTIDGTARRMVDRAPEPAARAVVDTPGWPAVHRPPERAETALAR